MAAQNPTEHLVEAYGRNSATIYEVISFALSFQVVTY